MKQSNITKARLEAKVNPDIYQLFKQAASMTGRTLTDFVIEAVYKESIKTINEHQAIILSLRDQQLLVDALNSYSVNSSMEDALNMHNKFIARKNTQ
ncbi:DUF1778 domain-containing protein [Pasteurella atlantica]|uniref:DUF1778 domain-containing protein n=2 Tax=Pasteurellaceae TaxID=712 RepID=A0ACC6HPP6_9PAST|nr:DUF1778 domain-containing protein [Pasteurella atlantica]MDP8052857.1 DUF1778 domain-containing protein [Pasteurella atlantica]MDP8102082.1 DUF1778 domain-containing protein [Pasteurella atlantica]MDP8106122.1 DUF1778 domain-containing protein [Pasteurella atlantica]MDP8149514.1 DUF1778 domain-containing protein [Pasteurella atlantica]